MNATKSGRLLDVAQAARILHVSDDTIRRRIADGSLEAFRVGTAGAIRIPERNLAALLTPYHERETAS